METTAADLGTWPKTVRRWRAKYLAGGVAAVGSIAPGRGRKCRVDASVIEAIVADTLNTVPENGSTQWSTRAMAARHGVGKDFVAAIDHRSERWNDDPKPFVWHRTAEEIIAKVRRGRAALDQVTARHH